MAWDDKGTYEKINYSLRPAKNIERKMMFEIFGRVSIIQEMSSYRYIGFGSAYFADFILAHKNFGITDLISIERDDEVVNDRFRFNKPYSCVKLLFGDSKEILPSLNLSEKKNIVWLDYDKHLNLDMIEDISTFFREACTGSMFSISVNVEPYRMTPGKQVAGKMLTENEFRYEKLKKELGHQRIPHEFIGKNLGLKENPQIIHTIINNEIESVLTIRNGSLSPNNKLIYKQLFNFLYKDGALMMTIGGILYDQEHAELVKKMEFEKMNIVRSTIDPLIINVPNLTYKEIRALDNLLPSNIDLENGVMSPDEIQFTPLPILKIEDIINYAKIYRFFPNFAESTQ